MSRDCCGWLEPVSVVFLECVVAASVFLLVLVRIFDVVRTPRGACSKGSAVSSYSIGSSYRNSDKACGSGEETERLFTHLAPFV